MTFCYDKTITKLMHGSDHDLYILKSCFNCSFVNFIDSSRVDVDLRRLKDGKTIGNGDIGHIGVDLVVVDKNYQLKNNLKSNEALVESNKASSIKTLSVRGLATLVKEYLNIPMSKDHQISEWKIRPIPATMIEYARRDSMIMPFLVHRQLKLFDRLEDLKDSIINGFRMAKKNKKPQQPLIKKLVPL